MMINITNMDDSTLSALRIVAAMIAADGETHTDEVRWFLQLAGHYGADNTQRQILRNDLATPPDVDEVYKQITNPQDREKLFQWLKKAIQVDGESHPAERALLTKVELLNSGEDVKGLTQELLEHERNIEMWRALNEAGKFLHQHVSPWRLHHHYIHSNWDRIKNNRKAFWLVVFVIIFLIVIKLFFGIRRFGIWRY